MTAGIVTQPQVNFVRVTATRGLEEVSVLVTVIVGVSGIGGKGDTGVGDKGRHRCSLPKEIRV